MITVSYKPLSAVNDIEISCTEAFQPPECQLTWILGDYYWVNRDTIYDDTCSHVIGFINYKKDTINWVELREC